MSDITDRIRKLMDLANHPATPAEEADLARERALYLIAKHNIDEAALRVGNGTPAAAIVQWSHLWITDTGGFVVERRTMPGAIAMALGAYVVTSQEREPGTKTVVRHVVNIFATADLIESLKLLLPSLMLQMESDNVRAVAEEKQRLADDNVYGQWDRYGPKRRAAQERSHMMRFRRSHYVVWANTVYDRIKTGVAQATEESTGTGAELVLVDEAARAKTHGLGVFPGAAPAATKNHRGSVSGMARGKADGSRARLGQTDIGTRLALPR